MDGLVVKGVCMLGMFVEYPEQETFPLEKAPLVLTIRAFNIL